MTRELEAKASDRLGRLSLILFVLMIIVGRFGPTAFTVAAWWILFGAGALTAAISLAQPRPGRKIESWIAAALFALVGVLTAWSSLASPAS